MIIEPDPVLITNCPESTSDVVHPVLTAITLIVLVEEISIEPVYSVLDVVGVLPSTV